MAENRNQTTNLGERVPDLFSALQMMRKRRRKVNKAKRAAEEITYLNIVAMMDMMTIILIFMLKSVSISSVAISGTEALALPYSTTQQTPIEAVKIFITKAEIVVEDKKVATVKDGVVEQQYISEKNKYLIPNLQEMVKREVERQIHLTKISSKFRFQGDLTILADKDTPYFMIMQVMYTSGRATGTVEQTEIGFDKYRLMVMRSEQ